MKRGSDLLVIGFIVAGLIILCSLGTWQVQRLYWKEQLIERVEARLESAPVPLTAASEAGFDRVTQEYQPVRFSAVFDHSREVYYFTTGKIGASGWHVHTPVTLDDGKVVIVNRGFVPFDLKLPDKRAAGQIEGRRRLEGLLRFPLSEKPTGSLANNPEKREFYWRNLAEMAQATQLQEENLLPVIVDLRENKIPGGWPKGGETIVSFPNNHLQYAVTWFGLALTLLGVGGYFLYSRRQATDTDA